MNSYPEVWSLSPLLSLGQWFLNISEVGEPSVVGYFCLGNSVLSRGWSQGRGGAGMD